MRQPYGYQCSVRCVVNIDCRQMKATINSGIFRTVEGGYSQFQSLQNTKDLNRLFAIGQFAEYGKFVQYTF